MTALSACDYSYRTGRHLLRGLALAAATALGACSSMPDSITSIFHRVEAPPVQQTQTPSAPTIDFATSTDIHPEIWPLGTSGEPRDPAIEAEVAKLLSQMTVEEKVGQLLQPDISDATPGDVRKYHLGSILNSGDTGPDGNLRAPPQDWLKAADAYYEASVDVAPGRAAIPLIWGIDAMHGNDHIIGATLFPHNIGLGAMRDPELVRTIGGITAQEIRVTGQDWTFAPTIAVARDDRWGRTYESYSEDPKVVAEYAAAMVEGLQGKPGTPDFLKNGHVIATAKHYIGDGGTDGGVNEGDVLYNEPAMRDLFAPPYEAAIEAGVQTVMASYSSWRGQKMHGSRSLLSDVLYGRLGFDGFVVSDYRGFAQLPGCTVDRCPDSINAGVDMFMTADRWKDLYANTIADVRAGRITEARLDEAVARILRVKVRAGLMTAGKPSSRPYAGQWDLLGSPGHRAVARQAVRESLVLLKNDGGILPLAPRLHVLVAGDGADNMSKQTGGWTITWQGTGNARADFPHAETIFEGIKANVEAAGGTATLSVDGSFTEKPDVAIVVFGEDPYAESLGDRPDVDFQSGDRRALRLLQSLQTRGIPVISVFLSGRPLYVTPEINASNAFVAAWLPGSEGEGIADLLFRKPDGSVGYDFRGKLSFSWPRAPDQTPLNVGTEPYFPLFAYGYGLTYAEPHTTGTLPLAPHAPAKLDRDTFVDAGVTASSWSASLVGAGGAVTDVLPAATVSPGGALRVSQGRGRPPALTAVWTGPASLVVSGPPSSLVRQARLNKVLELALRVDTPPAKQVTLAMGCGSQCTGKVDLTGALRWATGRGWTKIRVPLRCFRAAGTDLTSVAVPLELSSAGRLAIRLASAKIARSSGYQDCPAAPGT